MATKTKRIAPPASIAHALTSLLTQVERSTALTDDQRERYTNAAVKAFCQLIDSVRFEHNGDDLIFPSRTRSGLTHRVNGTCDCEAACDGQPCWHRAAKKLIELVAASPQLPLAGFPSSPAIYHCLHCGSPMMVATTPGGADGFVCVNPHCSWTIYAEAVSVFA